MANGTLKVQNIETSSGSGTITLGQSGETIALGASNISGFGKIGQVVSVSKTDTATTSSSSFSDISGLSINITPSSTSSKILIIGDISGGSNHGLAGMGLRIEQDISGGSTTYPYVGDAAGSRTQASFGAYVASDSSFQGKFSSSAVLSPSTTSQITYTYQFRSQNSNPVYINRSKSDANSADQYRNASSITAMEILG